MPIVSDAAVAIRGDLTGFHKDLQKAERSTATFGEKLRSALSPRNLLSAASVVGIGFSIKELIGFAGDASEEFQGLERATRSVDRIFDTSADTITEWGERAADAAGLSKREVTESAAVMGSMLQNVGFDATGAADEVVKLQQRGADLAATFGGTTVDAIDAVGSLLRGEFDTIEKYGVKIKQADINARILALGLDTSTDASKRNAEAVAALSVFYEQTGDASGRFAEDLDTLSGKMAANQAKIENFMATLGEGIADWQLQFIEDAERMGTSFGEAGDDFRDFAMNFGSQHTEILRLADALGVGFGEMKDRISGEMDATGKTFEDVVARIELTFDGLPGTLKIAGLNASHAVRDGLVAGGPVIAAEAGKIAGMLPSEIAARVEDVKQVGRDSVLALATAILERQNDPILAIDALNAVIEESLSDAELIAKLTGEDTMTALRTGLGSSLEADRIAAKEALQPVLDTLNSLGPAGEAAAIAMMNALALGMDNNHGTPTDAARRVADDIRAVFPFSEPKDPQSPFRGITQWGGNIVRTVAEGIEAEKGRIARALEALISPRGLTAAGPGMWTKRQNLLAMQQGITKDGSMQAYVERLKRDIAALQLTSYRGPDEPQNLPGAWTRRQNLQALLARVQGMSQPTGPASLAGMSPEQVGTARGANIYHVHMEDRMKPQSIEDVGYGLKRLGDMGVLPGARPVITSHSRSVALANWKAGR